MSYQAPVKDMLFNIQHLAGLETLTNQVPAFADFGLDTAAAVLEECAKLTQDVIAPLNFEGDKNPSSWKDGVVTTTPGFKQAFKAYAEGGWQGLVHPPEFGGQGAPKTIAAACNEMLQSANMVAKITTARFYAEHILPRTSSLRAAIVDGADSVTELSLEAF